MGKMMQLTQIKCPNCRNDVSHLEFWHKVEGVCFHLCSKCIEKIGKTNIRLQDVLRIGYSHGYEKARQDMLKIIGEM